MPSRHWPPPLEREASGRGGAIRTHDHLHPIQVRYQTAPRPDVPSILAWASEQSKLVRT